MDIKEIGNKRLQARAKIKYIIDGSSYNDYGWRVVNTSQLEDIEGLIQEKPEEPKPGEIWRIHQTNFDIDYVKIIKKEDNLEEIPSLQKFLCHALKEDKPVILSLRFILFKEKLLTAYCAPNEVGSFSCTVSDYEYHLKIDIPTEEELSKEAFKSFSDTMGIQPTTYTLEDFEYIQSILTN